MTQEEKDKLIERTSKFEAYQAVYLWAKGGKDSVDKKDDPLSVAWYAEQKMEGHRLWLIEQEFIYEGEGGRTGPFIPNDGRYEREKSGTKV